jgi:beta-lactamase regulating signal transducer with metallopeptidase domain
VETISRSLLTFLLNSLWQIPLVAIVALAVCRALRRAPAAHRHVVWVAALIASVLLPLASIRPQPQPSDIRIDTSYAPAAEPAAAAQAAKPATLPDAPRSVSFGNSAAAAVLSLYLLFLLYRLMRFGVAWMRTRRLCEDARPHMPPPHIEAVWARCLRAFGLSGVELRSGAGVSSPVAAGAWRRTVVLPESMFGETSGEVLTTAIGHELAHIASRDFAWNFLCELLYQPVSFHPGAWWIRRGIQQTRELACDELVTRRLIDPESYAGSILKIASAMTAVPQPGYTLGVFDGDILEERIKRLLERPAATLKRARLFLACGLGAIAVCAVIASGLALTARAQSAADSAIQQGVEAYNQGDLDSAIPLFRAAAAADPSNIRPKLFLGFALMRAFRPGTADEAAVAQEARQLYRGVLSLDPRNKTALESLMLLDMNTKQFDDAREHGRKLIELDPRNVGAYYSLGFLDWAVAYPQYMKAREAVGMKPADPGIISDPAIRQDIRIRVLPLVEDGFRQLNTALQFDPQHSDSMAYINLLYRIKAAIVDSTAESDDLIRQADQWVQRALALRKVLRSDVNGGPRLDANGAPPSASVITIRIPAPPPPPPPPPPGTRGNGDK